MQLRQKQANQVIWGCAVTEALAVGLNPIGVADVFGGLAVDAAMVVALANIYVKMSTTHARSLFVTTIAQAAGWLTASVLFAGLGASLFKLATVGKGTLLTALPKAPPPATAATLWARPRYLLQHGSGWGSEGPKASRPAHPRQQRPESILPATERRDQAKSCCSTATQGQ